MATTRITVLDPNSTHLGEVISLWKANNKTLGWFTQGAFEERARRGTILIAVSDDGVVIGYLLYYVTESQVATITHLCVSKTARKQGVASSLVTELKNRTKSLKSIRATCRKDFPAWDVWKRLGFVAIKNVIGRGKKAAILTRFVLNHKCNSLYDQLDIDETAPIPIAIDANIVFDFEDSKRQGARESLGLLSDWLMPLIKICVTQEMLNEIFGSATSDPNPERRLGLYEILQSDPNRFDEVQAELKTIIGKPESDQDFSDQRHIARAVASNVTVFVTRDKQLLRHSTAIFNKYGLRVIRPARLISEFDQVENETAYQRDRLAGTSLKLGAFSGDVDHFIDEFYLQQSDVNRASIQGRISEWQSNPRENRIFTLTEGQTGNETLMASFVMQCGSDGVVTLPFIRVANSFASLRIHNTLHQGIMSALLKEAVKTGAWLIEISPQANTTEFLSRCEELGFCKVGDCWRKVCLRGVAEPKTHATSLRALIEKSTGDRTFEKSILEKLESDQISVDAELAFDVEQQIWPAKVIGCGIPNFIIPIKAKWAKHLIDAGLGKGDLFGSDIDLVLNFEAIYYRSPIPAIVRNKSRAIWYVSKKKSEPDGFSGFVRSASLVDSVEIDTAKRAFKRYQRFGVYEWKDVFATARGDKDGKVMAIRFRHTEQLIKPVCWSQMQKVFKENGISNNVQSPVSVSDSVFAGLYGSDS